MQNNNKFIFVSESIISDCNKAENIGLWCCSMRYGFTKGMKFVTEFISQNKEYRPEIVNNFMEEHCMVVRKLDNWDEVTYSTMWKSKKELNEKNVINFYGISLFNESPFDNILVCKIFKVITKIKPDIRREFNIFFFINDGLFPLYTEEYLRYFDTYGKENALNALCKQGELIDFIEFTPRLREHLNIDPPLKYAYIIYNNYIICININNIFNLINDSANLSLNTLPGDSLGGKKKIRRRTFGMLPEAKELCKYLQNSLKSVGYNSFPDKWFLRNCRSAQKMLLESGVPLDKWKKVIDFTFKYERLAENWCENMWQIESNFGQYENNKNNGNINNPFQIQPRTAKEQETIDAKIRAGRSF